MALLLAGSPSWADSPASNAPCSTLLPHSDHGSSALNNVGLNLSEVARRNGHTENEIKNYLQNDDSYWLDECGIAFYEEPLPSSIPNPNATSGTPNPAKKPRKPNPPPTPVPAPAPVPAPVPVDYSKTFLLHSRLGSSKTIYINFVGKTVSGTAWNTTYNAGAAWNSSPFDQDGSPTTFSTPEMDIIRSVWQRVSEDYSAFDVDVTTEAPAVGAIDRTTTADTVFGTEAVVTNDTLIYNTCACAGLSYTGVFNFSGASHNLYQPSWIFTKGVGFDPKYIGEVVSHEVGHTLGLSHDGSATAAYYTGSNGWAPIMGAAYYQPLSQWSKGEYAGANNLEDDLAVIQAHELTLAKDEDANTAATGRVIYVGDALSGVISSTADSDWFTFTPDVSGTFTTAVNVNSLSPDLDAKINFFTSPTGASAGSVDTGFLPVTTDVAGGLSTAMSVSLVGGTTYYFNITGTGYTIGTTTLYSNYASIGNYTLSISGPVGALAITNTSLPTATVNVPYSIQLAGSGAIHPYTWSATGLPAGLTMSTTGVITGTVTSAGTSSVNVLLTDSNGTSISKTFSLVVADLLTITSASLPFGTTGVAYSVNLTATGGTAPYTWSATGLPAGVTLSTTGVLSGTPTTAATSSVSVTLKDATNTSVVKVLSLKVVAPLVISTASLAKVTTGVAYSATLAATGGSTPYTWSATGLPAGITISTAGAIKGTATVPGTYSVVVTLIDANLTTKTQTFSVLVVAPLVISTAALTAATANSPYNFTLVSTGGAGGNVWTSTTRPAWLALSSSGVLSGTPTAAGTSTITYTVTDSTSTKVSKSLTLTIAAALAITTKTLANATRSKAYSATLAATGGSGTKAWTLTSGALPSGIVLSSTGVISGTTTVAGVYNFTVTVSATGVSTSQALVLTVV